MTGNQFKTRLTSEILSGPLCVQSNANKNNLIILYLSLNYNYFSLFVNLQGNIYLEQPTTILHHNLRRGMRHAFVAFSHALGIQINELDLGFSVSSNLSTTCKQPKRQSLSSHNCLGVGTEKLPSYSLLLLL